MGDAWYLGRWRLGSADSGWGPAFGGGRGAENAEPELGLGPMSDLGVFGEAEPRKSENHLGAAAGGWPQ